MQIQRLGIFSGDLSGLNSPFLGNPKKRGEQSRDRGSGRCLYLKGFLQIWFERLHSRAARNRQRQHPIKQCHPCEKGLFQYHFETHSEPLGGPFPFQA